MSLGQQRVCVPIASGWSRIDREIYKVKPRRSEEHTSELQSQSNLVCRLLLEKKNTKNDLSICNTVCAQQKNIIDHSRGVSSSSSVRGLRPQHTSASCIDQLTI